MGKTMYYAIYFDTRMDSTSERGAFEEFKSRYGNYPDMILTIKEVERAQRRVRMLRTKLNMR